MLIFDVRAQSPPPAEGLSGGGLRGEEPPAEELSGDAPQGEALNGDAPLAEGPGGDATLKDEELLATGLSLGALAATTMTNDRFNGLVQATAVCEPTKGPPARHLIARVCGDG